MLEALIDCGIGETRALVLEGSRVVEAHIERPGWRTGDVRAVRLSKRLERRGIVAADSVEALLEPMPEATEGAALTVEVVREALPESGRARLAKVRATTAALAFGPDLATRLVRYCHAHDVTRDLGDTLGDAGWDELADAAATGFVPFDGGLLTISPTPAMTVIDIDGAGDLTSLANAAAVAAAQAIRCFGITGSIGIDFPTLGDRAARMKLGELLDAHLPAPFERTAINGFGFVQIVPAPPGLADRTTASRTGRDGCIDPAEASAAQHQH